jgi:Raf kinase inhibitor-like YbhB/YbcL family protein
MKRNVAVIVIFVCAFLTSAAYAAGFKLVSPDLHQGKKLNMEQVYNSFGCTGGNISPALKWEGAPKGTKSFAVTVYDPDAPTGSGWWHWLIFNIPPNVTDLPKNAGNTAAGLAPTGSIQSRTDFGAQGYGGACPPQGDKPHRYIFTVYALDIDKLPLDANVPGAMVGFFLHQHTLAKATVSVKFSR